MRTVSQSQVDAFNARKIPPFERVRPGIFSVPLAMPNAHNPFSYCYLLIDDRDAVHIIDPGFDTVPNAQTLISGLEATGHGIADVATIFSTHQHGDHTGLVDFIRARSDAAFLVMEAEAEAADNNRNNPPDPTDLVSSWGVPARMRETLRASIEQRAQRPALPTTDTLLRDGDLLPIPGRSIEVMLTPGHTPGHGCLIDRENQLIFTGDHILPAMFPGIGLGGQTSTNSIADYLRALDRISDFDAFEVEPGHGYRFLGLGQRREESRAHQLRRSRETALQLAKHEGASVWDIASRLTWTAGWENLAGTYLFSALNQTEMHMAFVNSDEFPG